MARPDSTDMALLPAWQNLDREELLAFTAALLQRALSGVDPRAARFNIEECYLDAKFTVAQAREIAAQTRESAALTAMCAAHEAWEERKSDKRYLAYAEARVTYERRRKAYQAAEKRTRAAWDTLDSHWKSRR